MYQEDMINNGDGCGGLPPSPRVSVDNGLELKSAMKKSTSSVGGSGVGSVGGSRSREEHSSALSERPYDESEFTSDQHMQRQYHQYPVSQEPVVDILPSRSPSRSRGRSRSPGRRRSLSPGGRGRSRSPGKGKSCSPGRCRGRSQSRTRNASRSPARLRRSRSRDASAVVSTTPDHTTDLTGSYHLMPLEMDAKEAPPPASGAAHGKKKAARRRSSSRRSKRPKTKEVQADERYEAQVALVIQFALLFFCALIVIAIVLSIGMALYSDHGYWLIIVLCLTLMVSLSLGLCCFLNQVLNEEDAPTVNQEHMPKWYRTVRKIVRDEWEDFKADWLAMSNDTYLLEDAKDDTSWIEDINTNRDIHHDAEDTTTSQYSGTTHSSNSKQNKKRRGKSALFKLVAKPAAMLTNFRRKRRGRRKLRKGQEDMGTVTSAWPSTV